MRRTVSSLDEFLIQMASEPRGSLAHERFMDLCEQLRLSDDLIASRTAFADNGYARNLVCRTPHFELLVLCWRPGQESTIHDHAGSLNAIRVHRGVLTSRRFRTVGDSAPGNGSAVPCSAGPVRQTSEDSGAAGSLCSVDRGGIHQLANRGPGDLVTVHVYAPPLMELNVYSTQSADTVRRTLRSTLDEDLG